MTSHTAQDPSEVDQETGNLSIWLFCGAHVAHAQRMTHLLAEDNFSLGADVIFVFAIFDAQIV